MSIAEGLRAKEPCESGPVGPNAVCVIPEVVVRDAMARQFQATSSITYGLQSDHIPRPLKNPFRGIHHLPGEVNPDIIVERYKM